MNAHDIERSIAERAGVTVPAAIASKRASDFEMKAIRWLWPQRFAIGKLGLIGGLPEMGKGQVCADIIARVTAGNAWPCGEGRAQAANVIWFSSEDAPEDTLVPRLVAAGADLDRVHIMGMVKSPDGAARMFNMATDLPALEAKVEEVGGVGLVIIDPMSAHAGVGKINNSSTTDVRGMLSPLTDLAERREFALIGVMHFNKKVDVTNAMLRIADSLAYAAAARHVYVAVEDADNKDARLLVKAKNNLAPDTYALRYFFGTQQVGYDPALEQPIYAPHVLWDTEHVAITANEAMEAAGGNKRAGAALREAQDFLLGRLAMGQLPATEVKEEAEANGISDATLRRARKDLGIRPFKEGGADGRWYWALPSKVGVAGVGEK